MFKAEEIVMKLIVLVIVLMSIGCYSGPHVGTINRSLTKPDCEFSPSIWRTGRIVAVCDTFEECNKICNNLDGNGDMKK